MYCKCAVTFGLFGIDVLFMPLTLCSNILQSQEIETTAYVRNDKECFASISTLFHIILGF